MDGFAAAVLVVSVAFLIAPVIQRIEEWIIRRKARAPDDRAAL